MVFGNVETETLQLNEDTVWAGGPYDSANPGGAAALGEIRRLVFENRWAEAQRLVDQAMLGRPVGQLAYQPVGNLRLSFPGLGAASEYRRELDLDTAVASVEFVAGGTRFRREVIASAVDQVIALRLTAEPGRARSRSRRSSTARSARPRPAPTPRRSRWTASRPTWRA